MKEEINKELTNLFSTLKERQNYKIQAENLDRLFKNYGVDEVLNSLNRHVQIDWTGFPQGKKPLKLETFLGFTRYLNYRDKSPTEVKKNANFIAEHGITLNQHYHEDLKAYFSHRIVAERTISLLLRFGKLGLDELHRSVFEHKDFVLKIAALTKIFQKAGLNLRKGKDSSHFYDVMKIYAANDPDEKVRKFADAGLKIMTAHKKSPNTQAIEKWLNSLKNK